MDNSPIMFKSAINGFDKKAVMSYIFELNENAQVARKKLTEQLEEAIQAKEALERQYSENGEMAQGFQAEKENLLSELEGERARAEELSGQIDTLNEEIDRLNLVISGKDGELEKLQQKLRQLQSQPAPTPQPQPKEEHSAEPAPPAQEPTPLPDDMQERYREMEEKRLEVERASAQIGRLLLDATADADRKRTEGRIEAEQLVEKAKIEAENILKSAKEDAGRLMAEARYKADKLVVNANSSLEEANRRFAGIRQDLAAAQRTIMAAASSMQDKAQNIDGIMNALEHKMIAAEHGEQENSRGQGRDGKDGFFRFAADK